MDTISFVLTTPYKRVAASDQRKKAEEGFAIPTNEKNQQAHIYPNHTTTAPTSRTPAM